MTTKTAAQIIDIIRDAGATTGTEIREALEDGAALAELGITDADQEAVEVAHANLDMTIADEVFAEIEAHEAEHGGVDVCDICGKRNPDVEQDYERERTTYTFDDGSVIIDEGDLGCWVVAEPLISRAEAAWGGPVATSRHLGIAYSTWAGYKSGVRAVPEYVRRSILAHLELAATSAPPRSKQPGS